LAKIRLTVSKPPSTDGATGSDGGLRKGRNPLTPTGTRRPNADSTKSSGSGSAGSRKKESVGNEKKELKVRNYLSGDAACYLSKVSQSRLAGAMCRKANRHGSFWDFAPVLLSAVE
jgi:hypothetical protein